jgi:hypothetical protein
MGDNGTRRVRLSGAQILVEYLIRQGVPYAPGIPRHGCWSLTDVDIRSCVTVLADRGYAGSLMVEQDSWAPPSETAAIGRRALSAMLGDLK